MAKDKQRASCTDYGSTDNSRFGEFAPLVGSYVALASLACAACIGFDLIRSLRWRKPWIAAKYFPLNAATLTILAVAIKIPSDTSEKMPGLLDQLAKLSGVVLVCISMNHMMPSLGVMNDLTIFSNMIALAILVVTLFANILFQCTTGLITLFRVSMLIASTFMLFIFFIFSSHAFTVTTVKNLLAKEIEREIQAEGYLTTQVFPVGRLKDYVNKYWLLARTSSPDYTLRSSGISAVSALLTYGLVGVGFISHITLILHRWRVKEGCYVRSDYKRSAGYIFGIQVVAVALGTIASLLRTLNSEPTPEFTSLRSLLHIEVYRIQKLQGWREDPLPFHVRGKIARKLMYIFLNLILLCLICLQRLITLLVKVVFSVKALVRFVLCLPFYCCPCNDAKETTNGSENLDDLQHYILHVEGVPLSKKETLNNWVDQTRRWIETGNSSQPTTIKTFLENFSTPSQGFHAIGHIYQNMQENETENLPNCWSLTVVTLATVIRASFKKISQEELMSIMKVAYEGFKYARFIDKNCPVEGSKRMIKAAKKVWDTVDLFDNWMNDELDSVLDKGDSLAIIRELHRIAQDYLNKSSKDTKSWPLKAIAADCLCKITSTISSTRGPQTNASFSSNINNSLFLLLQKALADTVGACFISLPRAILSHCSSGEFGAREERVRKAATILGEAETILNWLEEPGRMGQYPTIGAQYIDNWHALYVYH